MNKSLAVGVGLLLLVLLLLFSTTFTVKYNEVAIKRTFGKTNEHSVVRDAGLHFRLPVFIDTVTKLDTRLQLVESPLEEITTGDGLVIVVRAFLLWQIDSSPDGDGPLEFLEAHETIDAASRSLQSKFRTAFTGVLSRYRFDELIGEQSRLAEAEQDIVNDLTASLADEGIEPVTVGINQIVFPPKVSAAVLSRMQATRNALAEGERRMGTAEATRIRNDGKTKEEKILAFARQQAAEIRAEGEHDAARYLELMNEDPELAMFLTWLDALEATLNQRATVILPATGMKPFEFLNLNEQTLLEALPQPKEHAADDVTNAPNTTAAAGDDVADVDATDATDATGEPAVEATAGAPDREGP